MNSFYYNTTTSLVTLPLEILYLIIGHIINAKSFFNIALTCKLLSNIVFDPITQKKAKKRLVKEINEKGKHLYYIYPNKWKTGDYKEWYSNGQLWEQSFYVNDKLEGEYKTWHENGQLWEQCFYINDKIEDEYKIWGSAGQLYAQYFYKNGEIIE